jgi:hypothetical protein
MEKFCLNLGMVLSLAATAVYAEPLPATTESANQVTVLEGDTSPKAYYARPLYTTIF